MAILPAKPPDILWHTPEGAFLRVVPDLFSEVLDEVQLVELLSRREAIEAPDRSEDPLDEDLSEWIPDTAAIEDKEGVDG